MKVKGYKERLDTATHFIQTLTSQPLTWHISGSTARGDFQADSDIDITALWERSCDIPLLGTFHTLPKQGQYDIDLHGFAKDWEVFRVNPALLEGLFPDIKEG